MARMSATAENAAVAAVVALGTYLSLHTADPGTTGASETSGGSYARQALAFGTASGGSASNSSAISVPIAASTTISYFGAWSAVTSGTYEYGGALSASVTSGTSAVNVTFAAGSITFSAS